MPWRHDVYMRRMQQAGWVGWIDKEWNVSLLLITLNFVATVGFWAFLMRVARKRRDSHRVAASRHVNQEQEAEAGFRFQRGTKVRITSMGAGTDAIGKHAQQGTEGIVHDRFWGNGKIRVRVSTPTTAAGFIDYSVYERDLHVITTSDESMATSDEVHTTAQAYRHAHYLKKGGTTHSMVNLDILDEEERALISGAMKTNNVHAIYVRTHGLDMSETQLAHDFELFGDVAAVCVHPRIDHLGRDHSWAVVCMEDHGGGRMPGEKSAGQKAIEHYSTRPHLTVKDWDTAQMKTTTATTLSMALLVETTNMPTSDVFLFPKVQRHAPHSTVKRPAKRSLKTKPYSFLDDPFRGRSLTLSQTDALCHWYDHNHDEKLELPEVKEFLADKRIGPYATEENIEDEVERIHRNYMYRGRYWLHHSMYRWMADHGRLRWNGVHIEPYNMNPGAEGAWSYFLTLGALQAASLPANAIQILILQQQNAHDGQQLKPWFTGGGLITILAVVAVLIPTHAASLGQYGPSTALVLMFGSMGTLLSLFFNSTVHSRDWSNIRNISQHRLLRWNWTNICKLMSVIATAVQFIALSVRLVPVDVYTTKIRDVIDLALFDFGAWASTSDDESSIHPLTITIACSFTCVLLWLWLFGGILHHICLNMASSESGDGSERQIRFRLYCTLQSFRRNSVVGGSSYYIFSFLSRDVVVAVVSGLLNTIDCTFDDTLGVDALDMRPQWVCWGQQPETEQLGSGAGLIISSTNSNAQPLLAGLSLLLVLYYICTALILGPFVLTDSDGLFEPLELDVRYPARFELLEQSLKVACAASTLLFDHRPALGLMLQFNAFVAMWYYLRTYKPCSILWMNYFQGGMYALCAVFALGSALRIVTEDWVLALIVILIGFFLVQCEMFCAAVFFMRHGKHGRINRSAVNSINPLSCGYVVSGAEKGYNGMMLSCCYSEYYASDTALYAGLFVPFGLYRGTARFKQLKPEFTQHGTRRPMFLRVAGIDHNGNRAHGCIDRTINRRGFAITPMDSSADNMTKWPYWCPAAYGQGLWHSVPRRGWEVHGGLEAGGEGSDDDTSSSVQVLPVRVMGHNMAQSCINVGSSGNNNLIEFDDTNSIRGLQHSLKSVTFVVARRTRPPSTDSAETQLINMQTQNHIRLEAIDHIRKLLRQNYEIQKMPVLARLQFLETVPTLQKAVVLFGPNCINMLPSDREVLTANLQLCVRRFTKGSAIVTRGEQLDAMYVILRGEVNMFGDSDVEPIDHTELGGQCGWGMHGHFAPDMKAHVTCIAATPIVTVIEVTKSDYTQIVEVAQKVVVTTESIAWDGSYDDAGATPTLTWTSEHMGGDSSNTSTEVPMHEMQHCVLGLETTIEMDGVELKTPRHEARIDSASWWRGGWEIKSFTLEFSRSETVHSCRLWFQEYARNLVPLFIDLASLRVASVCM
eukprot:SAG25_NODE_323_length_9809_cov_4.314212_4_plen_1433_part_00